VWQWQWGKVFNIGSQWFRWYHSRPLGYTLGHRCFLDYNFFFALLYYCGELFGVMCNARGRQRWLGRNKWFIPLNN
jgi:hypothetical protein